MLKCSKLLLGFIHVCDPATNLIGLEINSYIVGCIQSRCCATSCSLTLAGYFLPLCFLNCPSQLKVGDFWRWSRLVHVPSCVLA